MELYFFLSILEGIGYHKQQEILKYCKSMEDLFCLDKTHFSECPKLRQADRQLLHEKLKEPDKVKYLYEKMQKKDIHFVSIQEKDYPRNLINGIEPPIGLFYKGRLPQNNKKKIAIVGTRNPSPYGKSIAKEIAATLSIYDVEIISGMARGIDGYSHEAVYTKNGATYAILAGGVDMIYPPEHRDMYNQIVEHGGVISEYPMGIKPVKGMFPRRNRIISGISDAVIVIEAKERSGSLITADCGMEEGKDVYVLPGRITDPQSAGCNRYIKQGAQMISSIPELLAELNIDFENLEETKMTKKLTLEKEDSMVYSCLRLMPLGLDELMIESGLGLMEVIHSISRLCQMGLAEECYRNQFVRSMGSWQKI